MATFGAIFTLGIVIGKRIEQQKFFDDYEEIEEDKPLVKYKERRKVYNQLGWSIDD